MRNFNRGRGPGRRDSKPRFGDSDRPERRDSKPSFREGRFSRDSDDRREFRKDVEMHTAICDRCGNKCEVPFKPRGNKPVYCSDCFRKGENVEPKNQSKDFDIINEKLDRILEALGK